MNIMKRRSYNVSTTNTYFILVNYKVLRAIKFCFTYTYYFVCCTITVCLSTYFLWTFSLHSSSTTFVMRKFNVEVPLHFIPHTRKKKFYLNYSIHWMVWIWLQEEETRRQWDFVSVVFLLFRIHIMCVLYASPCTFHSIFQVVRFQHKTRTN